MEISGAKGNGGELLGMMEKCWEQENEQNEEANGVQRCRTARMQQKTGARASAATERGGAQSGGDGVCCVVRGVVDGRKADVDG